mmetsp:Transcript_24747/g.43594  ORF Transcript_24747/g.43594 Transcript_24747/m.43594 type:complete len:246 (-) Transcript_24747:19-756(-)
MDRQIEIDEANSSQIDLQIQLSPPVHTKIDFDAAPPQKFSEFCTEKMMKGGMLAYKTEIVIHDLRQSLYWQSCVELCLMIFGLAVALKRGDNLVYLSSLHIVRGVLGLWVVLKLPRTYTVFDDFTQDFRKFEDILSRKANESVRIAFRPLAYYSIVTCFALVLDLILLIANLSTVDTPDNVQLISFMLTMLFLCLDIYLILWYVSLKFMYPQEIWSNLGNFFRFGVDRSKWGSASSFAHLNENLP